MEQRANPERQSPIIKANLLGRTVLLNYYNTEVYRYNIPFQHLSHVDYRNGNLRSRQFGHDELMEKLEEQAYPVHWLPWPESDVEDAYVRAQLRNLGNEYRNLVGEE